MLPAWCLGLLVVTALAVGAEPCTLYRPAQIDTARRNMAQHPWAKKMVDDWAAGAKRVMALQPADIAAFLPELTPWPTYGQSCPVCVGNQSSMGETGLWQWNLSQPEQVVCKYCKTVFPNAQYPETGVLDCPRMGQRFTYYETPEERAHPADRSGAGAFRWASWPVHTSWTGLVRTSRANYLVWSFPRLAKLYVLTGDVAYAVRCGEILDTLARRYPRWLYHSYNGVYADCPPGEAAAEMGRHPAAGKFPKGTIRAAFPALTGADKEGLERLNNGFWGAGRFDPGLSGEGDLLLSAAVSYDLIRDAQVAGRPVLDAAARQRIEQDLILAGCADLENYQRIDNKCGPARALSAAVARLLGGPAHAHRALDGLNALLDECFHPDGFCTESPSYSQMHLSLLADIPEVLAGYSDPPDYQPPHGPRLERFDPFQALPRYRLALESMVRMLRPDRLYPVLGDTHSGAGLSPYWAEVLAAHYGADYAGILELAQGKPLADAGSEFALWHRDPDLKAPAVTKLPLRSEWWPGWHVGVLRLGGADSPTAFYLNGYASHGHRHADTLGLVYHDLGRELASDRGYIWDDPRNRWTSSTLAHNLVTVDGHNQDAPQRQSTLELFGTAPQVEAIQASAAAYQACSQYRRTCVLVRVSPTQTYAVDIFRVAGGAQHQYGCNADGPLVEVTGPAPQPVTDQHEWLTHLRAAPAPTGLTARWKVREVGFEWRLLSPADRVVVADAPGWRSYKGDQLHAPPIGQVLAERRGKALQSTFVAVMTPFKGASPIRSATLLADGREGYVAVQVELAGRTDYVVSALDDIEHTAGPVTWSGRCGWATVDAAGHAQAAWLLAGTRLRCAGADVTLPAGRTPLTVTQAAGQVLTLAEPAGGRAQVGEYVLAAGSGWEVAGVAANAVTVRDYPLAACTAAEVLHSAWWTRS